LEVVPDNERIEMRKILKKGRCNECKKRSREKRACAAGRYAATTCQISDDE